MNEYIQITINAIFTGLGVALGTYLCQVYIIKRMNKLKNKIREVADEQKISESD